MLTAAAALVSGIAFTASAAKEQLGKRAWLEGVVDLGSGAPAACFSDALFTGHCAPKVPQRQHVERRSSRCCRWFVLPSSRSLRGPC